MQAASPLQDVLTHRLRSLIRMGPLHRIEQSKNLRALDLEQHDMRALSLATIDAVIESMGLGHGARRTDIQRALAPLVRALEPDCTGDRIAAITDVVVDHLLNEADRRLQFEEAYVSFDAQGNAVHRALRFHLLKEEESDDGHIVIRATTEAINVYAGMLDIDVEDAQTANAAVLQAQLARGAIGAAVATARQARLRSIQFTETVRAKLRMVRRDIEQVNTSALLEEVDAARSHLLERADVERKLINAVSDRLRDGGDDVASLRDLKDTLTDCKLRHLDLHGELIGWGDEWLMEQERQRFRPPVNSALPDLDSDVLRRLMTVSVGELQPNVEALDRLFHPASAKPVFSTHAAIEALLAPRREVREADLEAPDDALLRIEESPPRFGADIVDAARAWLDQGGRLGDLLERSRAAHEPDDVRRWMTLEALWCFDSSVIDARPVRADGHLLDDEFEGNDLQLGQPV